MIDVDLPAPKPRKYNVRGIFLMMGGFFAFSCADLLAKILTADYHTFQIVWTRQLGLLIGVIILVMIKGPAVLRTKAPRLQFLRGLAAITSALCFVFAISYVPLADAIAVTFIAPFFVTIMGAMFLSERVGIHRWSAIVIGFFGTLIIIRPGIHSFHPAILLVVLAALAFAFRQVVSRHLGASESTSATAAFTSATAITLLLIPTLIVWQTPMTLTHVLMMVALAGTAAAGELLIIRALEVASAVVVAPVHYSLILFGTFWGFVAFGYLPDQWTWIGAAIVTASGLYVLHRETRAKSNV